MGEKSERKRRGGAKARSARIARTGSIVTSRTNGSWSEMIHKLGFLFVSPACETSEFP